MVGYFLTIISSHPDARAYLYTYINRPIGLCASQVNGIQDAHKKLLKLE